METRESHIVRIHRRYHKIRKQIKNKANTKIQTMTPCSSSSAIPLATTNSTSSYESMGDGIRDTPSSKSTYCQLNTRRILSV